MVRFFMSLPLAFFDRTSRRAEIAKVPCFTGFLSTGLVWGESRCSEPLAPLFGCQEVSTPSRGFDAIEVGDAK
jgi:hypothetical protein